VRPWKHRQLHGKIPDAGSPIMYNSDILKQLAEIDIDVTPEEIAAKVQAIADKTRQNMNKYDWAQ
jgi:hypothetical protein